jgi:hypothetical protein
MGSLESLKQRKMDMCFITWNVTRFYRAGSLIAVAKELSKYKLDLMGIDEVRWDKVGTETTGDYTLFYGNGNDNKELGNRIFYIR